MRHSARLVLCAFLAAAPALAPDPAQGAESYDNCKGFIDTLPATISTQGVWCLRKDLNASLETGNAIEVATNNVTIDCNDFKVGNLLAGVGNTATGIHAVERSNLTVRNCSVRGFGYGIAALGTGGGHVIEDNRLDNSRQTAVFVSSDNSTIRHNLIYDTISLGQGVGIIASGNHDILDNTIDTVGGSSSSTFAIYLSNTENSTIRGNRIRTVWAGAEGAFAYGIHIHDATSNALVADNYLNSGGTVPLLFTVGIDCYFGDTFVRDNVVAGFTAALGGCFDDGGNLSR